MLLSPPLIPPPSPSTIHSSVYKKTVDAPNAYKYTNTSEATNEAKSARGCTDGGTCIRVVVPSSDGTSKETTQRLYIDWEPRKVFPVYTLTISAKMGVVNDVVWDDGCYFCEDDLSLSQSDDPSAGKCVNSVVVNGSVTDVTVANTAPNNGKMCWTDEDGSKSDVKIYIGWTGTDKAGRSFTSAGERFSRYKAYSWMNFGTIGDEFKVGMEVLTASARNPTQA